MRKSALFAASNCTHWHSGCTLSEAKLDWRGEPNVGHPAECRYFEELSHENQQPTAQPAVLAQNSEKAVARARDAAQVDSRLSQSTRLGWTCD